MRIPLSALFVAALLLGMFRLASSTEPRPLPEPRAATSSAAEAPQTHLNDTRLAEIFGLRPIGGATPHRHTAPPLRLRGTMVSNTGLSLASIDGTDGRVTSLFEGSRVGEWVLNSIDHRSVELTHDDGARMILEFGLATTPTAGAHSTVISIPRATLEAGFPGIARIVSSTTRVVPAPGGGFRIFFPTDSPLRAYQLEPGDVIRTLNGQPLTPELALSLYGQWRTVSQFTLGLERQGQPLTLAVDIH